MTYLEELWDLASTSHGIVTTAEAEEADVPPVELRKLTQRGSLRRLSHGVYQHLLVPKTRYTDAAEGVATVGEGGYLEWDSVLSLYDLALVDPPFVHVGVTRRYRGKPRAHVLVERRKEPLRDGDLTYHEGVLGLTVGRALIEAVDRIPLERIREAALEAEIRGLVTEVEALELSESIRLRESLLSHLHTSEDERNIVQQAARGTHKEATLVSC